MSAVRRRFHRSHFAKCRAMICKHFPGYKFEDVDRLTIDEVYEHVVSAAWLAVEEAKRTKR